MPKKYRYSILLLTSFLALWELGVWFFKPPTFILPPPSQIIVAMWKLKKVLFLNHLPITLIEILAGLMISIILAIILSLLMLKSTQLEQGIYPFLIASQAIPVIVLSPLIILWCGYGLLGKIAITVIITFFPIVVNTFEGLKNVDIKYINLLKTMGATPRQIFWKVRVPASLPNFFTGLKIGAAVSVIGAVIGEWLGGNFGLGVFSRRMSNNLQADAVFAAIIILAILGIALFLLVNMFERLFSPWSFNKNNKKGSGQDEKN